MDDACTRRDLLGAGWSARRITAAVRAGTLIRLRNGHYATAELAVEVQSAVRAGGRLACVSELMSRGLWLVDDPVATHAQVAPNAARLKVMPGVVVHWHPLHDGGSASPSHVGIVDALVRAGECLPRVAAIVAIDSALNRGLVSRSRLALVAEPTFAALLRDCDGSAESGLETIVRLLVRGLHLAVRCQVRFAGIGTSDLVVEGWIVIETDGSRFHDDAPTSGRDRIRDARHAAAGRTTLRFRYAQVVHRPAEVADAIIGAVETHRRIQNSGHKANRARARARRLGLA